MRAAGLGLFRRCLIGEESPVDDAGELFVARGFAATSTREIAERVGIRQASLTTTSRVRTRSSPNSFSVPYALQWTRSRRSSASSRLKPTT